MNKEHNYAHSKPYKRFKSNNTCSVPQCSNRCCSEISLHKFPKTGSAMKKWIAAFRMAKIPKVPLVCSQHFADDDFIKTLPGKGKRRRLKLTAVPSLNLPRSSTFKSLSSTTKTQITEREERLRRRLSKAQALLSNYTTDIKVLATIVNKPDEVIERQSIVHEFSHSTLMNANSMEGDGSKENYDISYMRCPYLTKSNTIKDEEVEKNPINFFKTWFDQATQCDQISEANAMCLATCTKDGFPSARYVLLKSYSKDGFVFFTNYESRKGKEIAENPNVAAVFYWEPLKKSVRIEGTVSKIPEEQSDSYFLSRPRESQIGACVSKQSTVIPNRRVLENIGQELKIISEDKQIPRPKCWGGFIIVPKKFEFWQGQSDRLHDRFLFRRPSQNEIPDEILVHSAEDGWVYERLSP